MIANKININPNCKTCGARLTLEEMHYFDDGHGEANCNSCERKWHDDLQCWKNGELKDFPQNETTTTC